MMARKQLYLITGFLGSGKTTLMKQLIELFASERIAVIVNEFGQQGVDGALLAKTGIHVEEISNGSIFCVCRSDLFVEMLVRANHSDADVVLVETSGLSDPTGMDRVLDMVTRLSDTDYDFRGTVAVVDAAQLLKLHRNVVAVKQQILSSGLVLLNKTDILPPEIIRQAEAMIAEWNPAAIVHHTRFCAIQPGWLDELRLAQQRIAGSIARNTLGVMQLLMRFSGSLDSAAFREWISSIAKDAYRIKGFVTLESGRFLVTCAGEQVVFAPADADDASYLVLLAPGNDRLKRHILQTGKAALGDQITFELQGVFP